MAGPIVAAGIRERRRARLHFRRSVFCIRRINICLAGHGAKSVHFNLAPMCCVRRVGRFRTADTIYRSEFNRSISAINVCCPPNHLVFFCIASLRRLGGDHDMCARASLPSPARVKSDRVEIGIIAPMERIKPNAACIAKASNTRGETAPSQSLSRSAMVGSRPS